MDNSVIKNGIHNIKYVLFSQFVFYSLGFLTSFVLPGVLGVNANGYYQVYIFYTTYVGVLHFGFNDGIYLRYGGVDYDELPRDMLRALIRYYSLFAFVEMAVFAAAAFFEQDASKRFAFTFVILNILVVNLSSLFNYINQISGRIKKYSLAVVLEKVQIVTSILLLLAIGRIDFKYAIATDFAAKLVVLFINLYNSREIVIGPRAPARLALCEYFDNVRVGLVLMLANFMGMLVMGLGRFILERFGSVANFSLYSFAMTSINLAMMFVSSVSLVLYPMLCRLDKKSLPGYYLLINRMLSSVVFVMMLIYYPLVPVIRIFLHKYTPTLDYLYLLFPIVIMQSKMQLLNNTYYKSLREEKSMLFANLSAVIIFLLLAVPLFFVFHSIKVIVWVTLATFTWRCYASEIYLKRKMGIAAVRNIFEELTLAAVFIVAAGLVGGIPGMLIYGLCVAVNLFMNRSEILHCAQRVINGMK